MNHSGFCSTVNITTSQSWWLDFQTRTVIIIITADDIPIVQLYSHTPTASCSLLSEMDCHNILHWIGTFCSSANWPIPPGHIFSVGLFSTAQHDSNGIITICYYNRHPIFRLRSDSSAFCAVHSEVFWSAVSSTRNSSFDCCAAVLDSTNQLRCKVRDNHDKVRICEASF